MNKHFIKLANLAMMLRDEIRGINEHEYTMLEEAHHKAFPSDEEALSDQLDTAVYMLSDLISITDALGGEEEKRDDSAASDPVNHPSHYTWSSIEPIDAIEAWQLPYHLGNVVKYVSRAGHKDKNKTLEDLKKASWYLSRYISNLEQEEK